MGCEITGVIIKPLTRRTDERGWLTELFREDELPEGLNPAMGYISLTHPGTARGPHEHRLQTDIFAFLSGRFEITLWENRPGFGQTKCVVAAGEEYPILLVIPPGVVHAYKNVGPLDAFVFNFPDSLYAGRGKKEEVDEIRHEDNKSDFKI